MPSSNRIEQSAVFAYRLKKGELQVLLVTSLDSQRWVLPKGHIEEDLDARTSALKEAFEEAGVEGEAAKNSVGYYDYVKTEQKGGAYCRVAVFAMKVDKILDDWPEAQKRNRKWMTVQQAVDVVREKKLKKLLEQFQKEMKVT